MKWARIGSAALLAFSLAACDSLSELTELEVVNENNPDRLRALQEAGDIESLISSGFLIAYNGQYDYGSAALALSAAGDETSCSWGNAGLQQLSSEPRVEWPNEPSWRYSAMSRNPWYDNYEALSSIYDGLLAIEGDDLICDEIDCSRARAFAKLVQGFATGWLALMYDSAFVFDETVDLENDVLGLQSYPTVMTAALGYLNEAITLASGQSWTTEQSWMNGYQHDGDAIAQIAHSLSARFMAQVARTPTERANADWAAIISHVDNGITADVMINGDNEVNWFNDLVWYAAQSGSTTWGRADYKTIGYTEVGDGGGYDGWLSGGLSNRTDFELHVPDLRIMPDPDSSRVAGLDFVYVGGSRFPSARGQYHYSMYVHSRYDDYPHGGYTAPTAFILYQSQQLLKAEGLLNQGDAAGAATIINVSRVGRGGLPAAAAGDADLFDMLRYEYQIENFIACPGCAYFSRRGWDALASGTSHHFGPVEGTALHFAVPGQELEILQKLMYSFGGVGNEGSALAPSAAPGLRGGGSTAPARMVYAFNGMESAKEKLDYIYRDSGKRVGSAMLTRH